MSTAIDEPIEIRCTEAGDTTRTTLRTLLITAAEIASEDDEPGLGQTADDMAALFRRPGVPSLSYWQIRNYTEVIDAAHAYEADATDWDGPGGAALALPDTRDALVAALNGLAETPES